MHEYLIFRNVLPHEITPSPPLTVTLLSEKSQLAKKFPIVTTHKENHIRISPPLDAAVILQKTLLQLPKIHYVSLFKNLIGAITTTPKSWPNKDNRYLGVPLNNYYSYVHYTIILHHYSNSVEFGIKSGKKIHVHMLCQLYTSKRSTRSYLTNPTKRSFKKKADIHLTLKVQQPKRDQFTIEKKTKKLTRNQQRKINVLSTSDIPRIIGYLSLAFADLPQFYSFVQKKTLHIHSTSFKNKK